MSVAFRQGHSHTSPKQLARDRSGGQPHRQAAAGVKLVQAQPEPEPEPPTKKEIKAEAKAEKAEAKADAKAAKQAGKAGA